MKTVSLSGSLRENVGKKDAKMNRRQGKIPCVIYGGKEQVHFTVNQVDLKKIIFTPNVYLIKLNINGKEFNSILQDVQYHPVTDNFLHVDFLEVFPDKPLVISIPVKFEGDAKGILKGGRLIKKIRKLKVKALPKDLPDEILLKIDDLDIGDSIKVSDVKRKNLQFLDLPNAIIVGVRVTRKVEEEVPTTTEGEEETAKETEEKTEEGTKKA